MDYFTNAEYSMPSTTRLFLSKWKDTTRLAAKKEQRISSYSMLAYQDTSSQQTLSSLSSHNSSSHKASSWQNIALFWCTYLTTPPNSAKGDAVTQQGRYKD